MTNTSTAPSLADVSIRAQPASRSRRRANPLSATTTHTTHTTRRRVWNLATLSLEPRHLVPTRSTSASRRPSRRGRYRRITTLSLSPLSDLSPSARQVHRRPQQATAAASGRSAGARPPAPPGPTRGPGGLACRQRTTLAITNTPRVLTPTTRAPPAWIGHCRSAIRGPLHDPKASN